jgi:prophage regulatory protein
MTTTNNETSDDGGARRKRMRLLSYQELKTEKGIRWSRQWLRKLGVAKKFPLPVQIGEASVGFVEDEIDDWIADRIKRRDSKVAA